MFFCRYSFYPCKDRHLQNKILICYAKKTNRPCGDAEPIRFNSPIINNRADKPVSQQVVSYFFVCTAKILPVCLCLCSKTVRFCIKTFKNALFIAFFVSYLKM